MYRPKQGHADKLPATRRHKLGMRTRTVSQTAAHIVSSLDLEGTRLASTTGLLELAALGADEGLLVGVRTEAEVLDRLASVLAATEEHSVAAGGGAHGELVEGKRLTASSLNARTSRVGEAERSNAELGHLEEALVVGDGADDDDSAELVAVKVALVAREVRKARNRHRGAVHLGHEQTAEDRLVEARVGAARKEAVKLHKEEEVGVLALRGAAVARLDVVPVDINSHRS